MESPLNKQEHYLLSRLRMHAWDKALAHQNEHEVDFKIAKPCTSFQKEENTLIFSEGVFMPECSSWEENIVVSPFSKAILLYGACIQESFLSSLENETDYFGCLAASFLQDGLFLYIPPNMKPKPLRILYHTQKEFDAWTFPRLHVVVGNKAELFLIESSIGGKSSSMAHKIFDIEEEGKMCHLIQDSSPWKAKNFSYVTLQKGASFQAFSSTQSGAYSYQNKVFLRGEGATVSLYGISQLASSHRIQVVHEKEKTKSFLMYKGVVKEGSFDVYGLVRIQKGATKSEARQIQKALLLEEGARASLKPVLEIFSSAVQVSHGASSGKLDEASLLYLQSRGLSKDESRKALIDGFCLEAIPPFARSLLQGVSYDTR